MKYLATYGYLYRLTNRQYFNCKVEAFANNGEVDLAKWGKLIGQVENVTDGFKASM